MTNLVIAIDPGKVTGMALWDPRVPTVVTTREVAKPVEVARIVNSCRNDRYGKIEVVSEKFTISQRTLKTALSLDALDINGWLKIDSQAHGYPYKEQAVQKNSNSFASDDKLQALGWFDKTPDMHAVDATRQLVVYLRSAHGAAFQKHLLPRMKDVL